MQHEMDFEPRIIRCQPSMDHTASTLKTCFSHGWAVLLRSPDITVARQRHSTRWILGCAFRLCELDICLRIHFNVFPEKSVKV